MNTTENLIERLRKRIVELEAQKGGHPAIDAGIQMVIDEINDRIYHLERGLLDPYG